MTAVINKDYIIMYICYKIKKSKIGPSNYKYAKMSHLSNSINLYKLGKIVLEKQETDHSYRQILQLAYDAGVFGKQINGSS